MNESRFRAAEERMWASEGLSPTEHRVRLDRLGLDLRFVEVGEGTPVVFVHGASNSGVSWANLVSRLGGFRCIVLDRPGCGLSPPIRTRFDDVDRLGRFAESLIVELLDALDLDRVDVVATSFGGYVAFRTAAAHPDRVRRVVEFGWTVGAPIGNVPFVMRAVAAPFIGRVLTSIPPNERVVRAMLRRIGLRQALDAGRVSQDTVACYLSLLRDTKTMRNELEAGPRLLRVFGGMDRSILLSAELLARVRAPVHFLWGEEDPFGGAEVARAFVAMLPHGELELVSGGGHAVWLDDADRAANVTRRFLAA